MDVVLDLVNGRGNDKEHLSVYATGAEPHSTPTGYSHFYGHTSFHHMDGLSWCIKWCRYAGAELAGICHKRRTVNVTFSLFRQTGLHTPGWRITLPRLVVEKRRRERSYPGLHLQAVRTLHNSSSLHREREWQHQPME